MYTSLKNHDFCQGTQMVKLNLVPIIWIFGLNWPCVSEYYCNTFIYNTNLVSVSKCHFTESLMTFTDTLSTSFLRIFQNELELRAITQRLWATIWLEVTPQLSLFLYKFYSKPFVYLVQQLASGEGECLKRQTRFHKQLLYVKQPIQSNFQKIFICL